LIPNFVIPTPPAQPNDKSYPSFRNWLLQYTDRIYNYLASWNSALAAVLNGGLPTDVSIVLASQSPFLVGSQGDQFIVASAGANPTIINLPPAVGSGNTLTVKKVDPNAAAVVVTAKGTDLIDGSPSLSITIRYAAYNLIDYAAGQWLIW